MFGPILTLLLQRKNSHYLPVLEFREEKQTFAKVERGNVDFFLLRIEEKPIVDLKKKRKKP
jgi:hypothetical protein